VALPDAAPTDAPDRARMLAPTRFLDSDHPDVIAFAREACGDAPTETERATRLFRAARERLRYDPYSLKLDPDEYRASTLLRRAAAYCVPKAVLLCAAARAAGIPARLGFCDVKNHLATEKLLQSLNNVELFVWHGYVELWLADRPIKATPAFNASLCNRFGVPPLEFDGTNDALLQPFDGEGRRYMEYVHDRGLYYDLPLDEILSGFAAAYGSAPFTRAKSAAPAVHDDAFHDDAAAVVTAAADGPTPSEKG
jgi:transglutaminase-like putative cysteine protease